MCIRDRPVPVLPPRGRCRPEPRRTGPAAPSCGCCCSPCSSGPWPWWPSTWVPAGRGPATSGSRWRARPGLRPGPPRCPLVGAGGRPAAAPAGGPAQRRGAGADLPPGHRLCGPGAGAPAPGPARGRLLTAGLDRDRSAALRGTVLVVVHGHQLLRRYAYSAALAGLGLLFLPVVLPARFSEVNGAKLWIRVGGLSVQPSEIAKILLVLFFADYLTRKRDVLALATRRVLGLDLPRGRDLGPVALAWLASLLVLVQEKD